MTESIKAPTPSELVDELLPSMTTDEHLSLRMLGNFASYNTIARWALEWLVRLVRRNERVTHLPTIVCLCGSTRFSESFQQANLEETLAGRIVLSIGCDMRSDTEVFAGKTEEELTQIKADLDELHKRKIDLADEVLILNVDGYIGASTASELAYAKELGKTVRYLETSE